MLLRALNHMATPSLGWDSFLRLAADIGCMGVEFRNDLPGPLFDGAPAQKVALRAKTLGLRVLALAEVKSFDDWNAAKADEATRLAQLAQASGAEALALIPRNDGQGGDSSTRHDDLCAALSGLAPILSKYRLTGLIEPLGFTTSSLRTKAEAVRAIDALGLGDRFGLIHDTFHHTLSGETALYPDHTRIVHASGVTDPAPEIGEMLDKHRVLVDGADRLNNLGQVRALIAGGYQGPISMEPFSPETHALPDPKAALSRSFDFIQSGLNGHLADEKLPLQGLPA